MQVATRQPRNNDEMLSSIEHDFAGISPAMRPGWWRPWQQGVKEMMRSSKPVSQLLAGRPESAAVLQKAVAETGLTMQELRYLPVSTRTSEDWVALLDANMDPVGYAPIDGFLSADPAAAAGKR